ncbi:MAG: DUF4340 domain-containing protein [Acidobacteria bacterium]|nr:DUF4340 domain-containing protein [Acidobacteriota bacterium]
MRIRGLLIAVVVLAALGGTLWWSNKAEKAKEGQPAKDAPPKVVQIPEDQIRQIEIARRGGEPTVVRKNDSNRWEMTAPKPLSVDQEAVNSVASALSSLNSDRLIEEKAADVAQYGLSAPALTVTVTRKDGKTEKLLFGDDTPTGGGIFAKLAGDPRVFTVASFNKSSLDKTSQDLRDKRLLTFDSDKLARVELSAKGQDLEFGKNNQNEWQIVKPRPMRADSFQIEELIRKLKDAKMDTSLSEEDAKKAAGAFWGAKPVATARATDAGGTQQMEVRKDKDNNYYARSSAVEGTHKIASDLGDALDKGADEFRNKKLFDFGFSDPNRVEITRGGKTVVYQKSGDKWMAGSRQMDSASVQALIDKLRDLSSVKFLEKGLTTPVFAATVASNEGKRTEKIAISKSGANYLAVRENEASVYELDGSVFAELEKAAGEVKDFQPPKNDKKK